VQTDMQDIEELRAKARERDVESEKDEDERPRLLLSPLPTSCQTAGILT
jgi:hypothetical protein